MAIDEKNKALLEESSNYKKIDNEDQKANQRIEEVKVKYSTLHEDVCKSVLREFVTIFHKLQYVALPRCSADPKKNLKNCKIYLKSGDLWGPLFFTILISILVSIKSFSSLKNTIVVVFSIVWIGGLIITLNIKMLGSKISLFQTIGILGYCLFPAIVGAIAIQILSAFSNTLKPFIIIKLLICLVVFLWSSLASISFIGDIVKNDRKGLALYPIFLFYFACSCILATI